jgi:3-oxoacyl-[acyl-carrier protein] reductase
MGVRDRVAIVTGSGQGIGAGVAEKLAAEGARVVVNDVVADRAEAVASRIREAGGQALAVAADVSRKEGAEELASRALEAFGQVDILVNNAGIARDKWLVKMSDEDWTRSSG